METVTEVGLLEQGGVSYIGGEGTGWTLKTDQSDIEVEVEQVTAQAMKLNGKRVAITGRYIAKQYIERGLVEILLAEQITVVA
jgi:hypothetical protein